MREGGRSARNLKIFLMFQIRNKYLINMARLYRQASVPAYERGEKFLADRQCEESLPVYWMQLMSDYYSRE